MGTRPRVFEQRQQLGKTKQKVKEAVEPLQSEIGGVAVASGNTGAICVFKCVGVFTSVFTLAVESGNTGTPLPSPRSGKRPTHRGVHPEGPPTRSSASARIASWAARYLRARWALYCRWILVAAISLPWQVQHQPTPTEAVGVFWYSLKTKKKKNAKKKRRKS